MVDDLVRPVTHEGYGKAKAGLEAHSCKVEKVIFERPFDLTTENVEKAKNFVRVDHCFAEFVDVSYILPVVVGGICYITLIAFCFVDEEFDTASIVATVILSVVAIYFTVYFFTKPKKENILNRRDGLITFDGFHWQSNITMPFDELICHFSTGGDDGAGSFNLLAVRPSNYSYASMGVDPSCYQAISFLTWYMDKNRPLPPGTAFDPYRQLDFERRKAEGFPPPLYTSNVPTPEATPEQQKEREKYWKETFYKLKFRVSIGHTIRLRADTRRVQRRVTHGKLRICSH